MYFRCPHCKADERVKGGPWGSLTRLDTDTLNAHCLECDYNHLTPHLFLTEALMISHYKKIAKGKTKSV